MRQYRKVKRRLPATKMFSEGGIANNINTNSVVETPSYLDEGEGFSKGSTVGGAAVTGASMGATFGPWGAAAGAVVGAGVGLAVANKKEREFEKNKNINKSLKNKYQLDYNSMQRRNDYVSDENYELNTIDVDNKFALGGISEGLKDKDKDSDKDNSTTSTTSTTSNKPNKSNKPNIAAPYSKDIIDRYNVSDAGKFLGERTKYKQYSYNRGDKDPNGSSMDCSGYACNYMGESVDDAKSTLNARNLYANKSTKKDFKEDELQDGDYIFLSKPGTSSKDHIGIILVDKDGNKHVADLNGKTNTDVKPLTKAFERYDSLGLEHKYFRNENDLYHQSKKDSSNVAKNDSSNVAPKKQLPNVQLSIEEYNDGEFDPISNIKEITTLTKPSYINPTKTKSSNTSKSSSSSSTKVPTNSTATTTKKKTYGTVGKVGNIPVKSKLHMLSEEQNTEQNKMKKKYIEYNSKLKRK